MTIFHLLPPTLSVTQVDFMFKLYYSIKTMNKKSKEERKTQSSVRIKARVKRAIIKRYGSVQKWVDLWAQCVEDTL